MLSVFYMLVVWIEISCITENRIDILNLNSMNNTNAFE